MESWRSWGPNWSKRGLVPEMGSNPSLKQLALGRSCQPATFVRSCSRFGRFDSHATLKGKFGMRYLILPQKNSQLFSSHHLFLGTMMWTYRKKALPTSSNQQDHRIHGGSKNARLPHRSHWKCWRKGSPQRDRELVSRLSRLPFDPFHSISSDASKEVCKSDCSWGFFQPRWRRTTKTWEDGVSFWSPMKRGAVITHITCAMPKAVLLSVRASPLEGVPLPALVPFLVGLP